MFTNFYKNPLIIITIQIQIVNNCHYLIKGDNKRVCLLLEIIF